jgi:uncharacterized protein YdaU (DUF1376 family)
MTLPDPPVPADLSVRHFDFMPLDVRRLRDSRLAIVSSGDEFRAAVLLWCAAWHQIPAGSLPSDDRELMALAGVSLVSVWESIRAGALHGFVLHSDKRMYHSVIVEKALNAHSKSTKASQSASRRWSKTPRKNRDGMRTQCERNANAMRTQCCASNAIEVNGMEVNGKLASLASQPVGLDNLDKLVRILDKTRIVMETINPATRTKLAQALDRYGESEFTDAVVKASAAKEYNGKPIANPAAWALARLANRAAESAEKRDRHAIPPGGREIAT